MHLEHSHCSCPTASRFTRNLLFHLDLNKTRAQSKTIWPINERRSCVNVTTFSSHSTRPQIGLFWPAPGPQRLLPIALWPAVYAAQMSSREFFETPPNFGLTMCSNCRGSGSAVSSDFEVWFFYFKLNNWGRNMTCAVRSDTRFFVFAFKINVFYSIFKNVNRSFSCSDKY